MSTLDTPSPAQDSRRGAFEAAATFGITVALLYFGAGLLVPVVLAILLAFALTPLVNFLERRLRIPGPLAVVLAVLLAASCFAALIYFVALQLIQLAGEFSAYQDTVATKLRSLQQQVVGADFVENLVQAIEALGAQFSAALSDGGPPAMPVTIANDFSAPMSLLGGLIGSLLGPLATVFIVVVFLIFVLMGRTDIQERFLRISSRGNYSTTTLALRDAGKRLSRYLLIQLCVNASYGAIFGIGLMIIGVPGALLWGMLIGVFRYIPFVGALLVAIIPFLLAFAVDPGWSMLIITLVFFLVLDQVTANVVEPRLYGSSTGVSGIAILLSAMFWAALWGPVGLILSTPMTVCLVVLGRYMPFFKVFETLLGSEPVLTPTERLYQRMLQGNTAEAIEIADETVEAEGKDALYDELMLPVLRMAQTGLTNTPEGLSQRRKLADTIEGVIDEYGEGIAAPKSDGVLLIGAQSEIDEAAARIIAQRLAGHGIGSTVLPAMAVRQESISRLDLDAVKLVVLAYVGPAIRASARYVTRRIKRMRPDIEVIVCHLHETESETASGLHVDGLSSSFADIVAEIETRVGVPPEDPAHIDNAPSNEAVVAALEEIADRFGVPLATLNLLTDERLQDEPDAFRLAKLAAGTPLVIHTGDEKNEHAQNPYLLANGIEFYAAVPLLRSEGEEPLGSLALVGYEAHEFDEAALQRLKEEAARLVSNFVGKPAA